MFIIKRKYPVALDGEINALKDRNAELEQLVSDQDDALVELAELAAEQDDALVELAELIIG